MNFYAEFYQYQLDSSKWDEKWYVLDKGKRCMRLVLPPPLYAEDTLKALVISSPYNKQTEVVEQQCEEAMKEVNFIKNKS